MTEFSHLLKKHSKSLQTQPEQASLLSNSFNLVYPEPFHSLELNPVKESPTQHAKAELKTNMKPPFGEKKKRGNKIDDFDYHTHIQQELEQLNHRNLTRKEK